MTEQFKNVIKDIADSLNELTAMDEEMSCDEKVQEHIEKAADFVKANCSNCPNQKKDVVFCDHFINEVVVAQVLGQDTFEGGIIGCNLKSAQKNSAMIVCEWTPQVLAEIKELKSFLVGPDAWMSIEQKRELISTHYMSGYETVDKVRCCKYELNK